MNTNTVRLIGYAGHPPKTRTLQNGVKKAVLLVATHYPRKKKTTGEKTAYATDWHWVVGWEELASYMERSFVRGSHVLVEGRIVYRGYTNAAGFRVNLTDIHADRIMNLDR
jgi:single-strand DNA-binding protein